MFSAPLWLIYILTSLKHNRFIQLIFFGNFFYGLCAVALSVEASLQQKFPVPSFLFFILLFSATVLFYNKSYNVSETTEINGNPRTHWYANNQEFINRVQILFSLIVIFCSAIFFIQNFTSILNINVFEWSMIFVFPLTAILYYGINVKFFGLTLRNIGWLKPFIIGFTWAGLVTVYPVLFYCMDNGLHYEPSLVSYFLFIKNFMFVTVLCMMFDIKDYAMDYNQQLKTFVVNVGLRKTIFYIIIPLCIVGLGSFIAYGLIKQFHVMRMFLNAIPFLLVLIVAYSLQNRRSIFYYLIIIDGLMLVKALCGSLGMVFY